VTRTVRTATLAALLALASTSPAGVSQVRHLVLVTLDGVRVEEMFGGMDDSVLRHSRSGGRLEDSPAYGKYAAPSREDRRRRLMPFLWGTLLRRHGSIVGDRAAGSRARLANRHGLSYPGYSEMLTGRAHDDVVQTNDLGQNPYPSVLEFLRRRLGVARDGVAVFASWGTMARIAEHEPGSILVNAGPAPYDSGDPVVEAVNRLQADRPSHASSARPDACTFELALAHLRLRRPRVLYVSLDETDALAHEGRYADVLDALARTDRRLERLWQALQADPQYRDSTALVITTDHGRGRTPESWAHHGREIPGTEDVWAAFVTPGDVRRGVWRGGPEVTHDQIAATLARLLGLDFASESPSSALPIRSFARL
jgi:Type I phosphodiesterase / nucleotide pyrophosphatase